MMFFFKTKKTKLKGPVHTRRAFTGPQRDAANQALQDLAQMSLPPTSMSYHDPRSRRRGMDYISPRGYEYQKALAKAVGGDFHFQDSGAKSGGIRSQLGKHGHGHVSHAGGNNFDLAIPVRYTDPTTGEEIRTSFVDFLVRTAGKKKKSRVGFGQKGWTPSLTYPGDGEVHGAREMRMEKPFVLVFNEAGKKSWANWKKENPNVSRYSPEFKDAKKKILTDEKYGSYVLNPVLAKMGARLDVEKMHHMPTFPEG